MKVSLKWLSEYIDLQGKTPEELEEIINYFEGSDLTMVKAALKKLSQ